jgi:hypothetical protein
VPHEIRRREFSPRALGYVTSDRFHIKTQILKDLLLALLDLKQDRLRQT